MNLTAMQERLRQELLRRIQRRTLSVSLLARQTGFGESHISNFLRSRRQLSLEALDRVLTAQQIDLLELLAAGQRGGAEAQDRESIPVVSAATAMFEPNIRAAATLSVLHAPAEIVKAAWGRGTQQRRMWQRFVAVKAEDSDARAMSPLLQPGGLVLIDRHYISLVNFRANRENIYAVRAGLRMAIRHVDFQLERLVLRPCNSSARVELVDLGPSETPGDLIVGRVVLIVNEV